MSDTQIEPYFELRSIMRAIPRQDLDRGDSKGCKWSIVSTRQPTEEEQLALCFAWKACQYVKSNAVVFAE